MCTVGSPDYPLYEPAHAAERVLSSIGVKRVSAGSALSRAAVGAFLRAAREMRERGTFTFATEAVSYREISDLFKT